MSTQTGAKKKGRSTYRCTALKAQLPEILPEHYTVKIFITSQDFECPSNNLTDVGNNSQTLSNNSNVYLNSPQRYPISQLQGNPERNLNPSENIKTNEIG